MCLGDVVDHVYDATRLPTPAPPNSPIFPTRSYAEHPQWIQSKETRNSMARRPQPSCSHELAITSRSLRTNHQKPTKPSSRACTVQPHVYRPTGTYPGAHQRARSLRRSEVTDRHGHYRCAIVTHPYPGAPLLGRCLCPTDAALEYATCGLLQRVPGLR